MVMKFIVPAMLGGAAILALSAQTPRFERVQPDLFATGGAFVSAWADYDSDGDLDQFVGFDGIPNRLYRNDGGRFVDAAGAAGLADPRPTRAAAWGDADADGDSDLLVGYAKATAEQPSVLAFYRNTNGVFADHTQAVGLTIGDGAVRQPAWVDFDADGDLDLFVAYRDRANALFRNDGGRFIDVAEKLGLADTRRTVGAVWFDHDEDGDLDVIVGNMDGDANGLYSFVYTGFADVAREAGVEWGGRTPGDKSNGTVRPCVADVNNDGRVDLFFANYGKNGLFLNRGKGRYEDVSAAWGIDIDARYDSCAFADMDNDGDLDLYVNGTVTGGKQYPDYLFRNSGSRFENVTPAEIGSPNSDHGVQWVDFDLDGDVDLSLTGVQKTGMHWLLRNALPSSSTPRAINLRVVDSAARATLAGYAITFEFQDTEESIPRQTRLVDGGSGYNSQNDIPLTLAAPSKSAFAVVASMRQPGNHLVAQRVEIKDARQGIHEVRLRAFDRRLKMAAVATTSQEERIVAVHEEPRHRLVFDSPAIRVLDVQIAPGDTTLFHTHSDPILYVTMSTSRTRNQNLSGEWSGPPSQGVATGEVKAAPTNPPGRLMSTTTYAERPQTHRVNNIGATLFRLIGIINSSAGDAGAEPSEGFGVEPELSNRWFRGYRLSLNDQATSDHTHANPVVVVLVGGAASVSRPVESASTTTALRAAGDFVVIDRAAPHRLRGTSPGAQVVEIEIRRSR